MPTRNVPLIYLDQNIFSTMLQPERGQFRRVFQNLPARLVISDTHFREMRGRPRDYADLLNSFDCHLLVQQIEPGSSECLANRATLIELHNALSHLEDQQIFAPIRDGFEDLFGLFHYWMGADRSLEYPQAMQRTRGRLKASLSAILTDVPALLVADILKQVDAVETSPFPGDMKKIWQGMDMQISAARTGDPMRDMTPLERVDFVLSKLPGDERAQFLQQYPFQFATARPLTVGELAGLSLAFFTMGAVKTKGIISGNRSERRFAAQMRDTHHIEAAAYSDAFLTADQDAAILAAMTYAHAGVATEALIYRAHPTR